MVVWGMLAFSASAQHDYAQKTQEIDSLLSLSYQGVVSVDAEASLDYALQALSASEQIGFSEGKSKACFYVGQALFNLGSYENALHYLSLSEKEDYSEQSPLLLSEISRVRGRILGSMELHAEAISEFKNGLVHIQHVEGKQNQQYLTSLAYDNLTNMYKISGQTDSVLVYILKNAALLRTMDESLMFRSWVNLYTNWGENYASHEKYDSAIFYFNESLRMAEKYDYPYTSMVYRCWGDAEFKRQNNDASMMYYRKALHGLKNTKLKNELATVYKKIEQVYSEQSIADSANWYREKAVLLENEILTDKNAALELAFHQILEREIKEKEVKRKWLVTILILCFSWLLIAVSVVYVLLLRKKSSLLEAKNLETLSLKDKLNDAFDEVLMLARKNDPAFLTRFQEVYPDFSRNLLTKHPDIVSTEFSFCAMIFLNLSSKEIAQYTFIEHRSVQTKKTRLRKKLGVSPGVDLYHYLQSLA